MSSLLNGIARGIRRASARAIARYREILQAGDAATSGEVEELRLLMIELGKSEEDVRADMNLLNEHRRLTELADQQPAREAEADRTREANETFCNQVNEKIKALQQSMLESRRVANAASLARITSFEAVGKLRELGQKSPDLLQYDPLA